MPKLRPMPKIECENEKQTASCRFSLTGDNHVKIPRRC